MSVFASALLLAAAPTAAALDDARTIAANGTLSTLAPMLAAKDIEDMIAAHPELDAAAKSALRETGDGVAKTLTARLIEAEARAFAASLSPQDLHELARTSSSEASRRMRAALPAIITATMAEAGAIDLKREIATAYCAKTGKLCT